MSEKNISKVWPEWSIERLLGSGQCGRVYKVSKSDGSYTTYSAIKVITVPADPTQADMLCKNDGIDRNGSRAYFKEIVDSFMNEIRTMDSFKNCPNIVRIEDYKVYEAEDDVSWDIFIRMELLTPVNEYFFNKPPTEEQAAQLGIDICSAIEVLSKKNIVHRDIKPENVFINEYGNYKLGDFGTARVLSEYSLSMTQCVGTPYYMAPEIYMSTKYDSRADIYSLGIVLYRLLNKNRLPFLDSEKQLLSPSERQTAFMKRISGEKLTPPREASPEMADIILKACAFDPKDRFSIAAEMKKALRNLIKTDEGREAPPTDVYKPKKPRKASMIAGLSAALLSVLIIGYFLGYARTPAGDVRGNISAVPVTDDTPASSPQTSDTAQEQIPSASVNTDVPIAPEPMTTPLTTENETTTVATAKPHEGSSQTASPSTTSPLTTTTPSTASPSTVASPATSAPPATSQPPTVTPKTTTTKPTTTKSTTTAPKKTEPKTTPSTKKTTIMSTEPDYNTIAPPKRTSSPDFVPTSAEVHSVPGYDITWSFDSGTLYIGGSGEMPDYSYSNAPWHDIGAKVSKIIIGEGVTYVGEMSFRDFNNVMYYNISSTVEDISGNFGMPDSHFLYEINVDKNNKYFVTDDYGALFTKDMTRLLQYPNKNEHTKYTIQKTVKIIDDEVFSWCYNLKEVELPNGLEQIGSFSFGCSSIRRLDIPASVTSIHTCFCRSSAQLSEINVDKNNKYYSSIDGVLFDKEAKTLLRYPEGKTDESYTVPNTVAVIDNDAVFRPKFKEITIPATVVYIVPGAFSDIDDLTVYGEPGSAAEKLAKDNGYKFVAK